MDKSDCQQELETADYRQVFEPNDYQQQEEFSDCQQQLIEDKNDGTNSKGNKVISLLQLEISDEQIEYPEIGTNFSV